MADTQIKIYGSTAAGGIVTENARDEGDNTVARTVELREDARPTFMKQILITLSGTPNTTTTTTLPAGTKGIRLYPSADVRYNINAAPAALATSSSTTVAANAFGAGNTAKANALETRLIPTADGTTATLQIASTTASATVTVEVF